MVHGDVVAYHGDHLRQIPLEILERIAESGRQLRDGLSLRDKDLEDIFWNWSIHNV